MYFGGIVPCSFLLVLNGMIIYKATRMSRAKKPTTLDEIKRAKKRNEMVKTIVFITFLYIAVELPCDVFTGFLYPRVRHIEFGDTINAFVNNIQFTYPTFNIFTLYFSNKLFATELKLILNEFKIKLF